MPRTRVRLITKEELAWLETQPVVGPPSLPRLRVALVSAGLAPVEIAITDDSEMLRLRLLRAAWLQELNREQMLRLLILALRRAGFEIGFAEVCIADMEDAVVQGFALTGSLDQICTIGSPAIEQ